MSQQGDADADMLCRIEPNMERKMPTEALHTSIREVAQEEILWGAPSRQCNVKESTMAKVRMLLNGRRHRCV
ncbi:hypothetical protein PSACC_01397 [Paramicrosporidium saccamoebae]|uniref:Uncharacterized protein n=1 Tax=Paramicrosporidium saccamoebae TaxID=1246581 RepID=A0A2H9TLY0_9FUNG|nr:hypothetical protein PSACC_01397 [Paramicrosporidium saccamoebae]